MVRWGVPTPHCAILDENARELDTLAFSLIIFLAVVSEKRDHTRRLRFPTILGTIAEDATRYFLVIFTAHLAFELTLNLGPVSTTISLFLDNGQRHLIRVPSLGRYPASSWHVSCHRPSVNATLLTVLFFTTISGVVV